MDSVGNAVYNLTKNDTKQIRDARVNINPNQGGHLLQQWNTKRNGKSSRRKITNFIESSQTSTPNRNTGSKNIPPIGNSFMYTEKSSNIFGPRAFVSFERTDFIQISGINFNYERYSDHGSFLGSTRRLRIQLL